MKTCARCQRCVPRLAGRGLCKRCYRWAEYHHQLHRWDTLREQGERPKACVRCGLPSTAPHRPLCADCAVVTRMLGEWERWAS